MNRAQQRTVRRDLRHAGCTCHPTLTPITDAYGRRGYFVRHQDGAGCPLGWRAWLANRAGIVPELIGSGRPCTR